MLKLLCGLLILLPTLSHAAVTRVINGQEYNLYDDFDTADGECVLRGYEYASSFYSMGTNSTLPVVKLNPDGSVDEVLQNFDGKYPIIAGIYCTGK